MPSDRKLIRDAARRLVEIARTDVNRRRRELWLKHNALRGERPMVLAEPGGVLNELNPELNLRCADEDARGLEWQLKFRAWHFENVSDDAVVEPVLNVGWKVDVSGYGVQEEITRPDESDGRRGSMVWDAPIKDIARDFHLLHKRTFSVDREATLRRKAELEELVGDILNVRIRGSFWWTLGLTWTAIRLIGLENLMLFMYDDPDGLHRLMAFLRDDHLAFAEWLEREGLLTLNNENDYVGSGGHGYTDELPKSDIAPDDPARLCDLWVLSESQETVGVGPEMFDEFVFRYQQPICERFGLTYYGCCEPVHTRWHVIRRLGNLRTVSISPWCDQSIMAEQLGRDYVFARKPAPSLISTARWDEDAIRADIRETLEVADGCEIEFAMKDVHTLNNEPWRLGRWVQLARETIDEHAGSPSR